MITVFYNKKSLKDTLVVILKKHHSSFYNVIDNKYAVLYDDKKELIGINIFGVSNDIVLNEGYLFPDKKIIEYIKKITNISLDLKIDAGLVVGKVIECNRIPNSHLSLTKVDVKNQILQIVCGANNVRQGLKVVCALVNTIMPSGLEIIPSKLLSHDSFGMLCSYKELNIQQNNTIGIIELDDSFNEGDIFKPAYKNLSN